MKIQCGEKQILNAIYDGAYDEWTTNKSLHDICRLGSYTVEGEGGTTLHVMNYFLNNFDMH